MDRGLRAARLPTACRRRRGPRRSRGQARGDRPRCDGALGDRGRARRARRARVRSARWRPRRRRSGRAARASGCRARARRSRAPPADGRVRGRRARTRVSPARFAVQLDGIADPVAYRPFLSFTLFAAVLLGGARSATGAVAGTAAVALVFWAADRLGEYADVATGRLDALFAAVLLLGALAIRSETTLPALLPRRRIAAPPRVALGRPQPARLEARGLRKHFGGDVAVDGLDLVARAGHGHGARRPERLGEDDRAAPPRRDAPRGRGRSAARRRGACARQPSCTSARGDRAHASGDGDLRRPHRPRECGRRRRAPRPPHRRRPRPARHAQGARCRPRGAAPSRRRL